MITPPDRTEAAESYFTYIDQVPPGDILGVLEGQLTSTVALRVLEPMTRPAAEDAPYRELLARMLAWADAHAGFEAAVANIPANLRANQPPGLPVLGVAAASSTCESRSTTSWTSAGTLTTKSSSGRRTTGQPRQRLHPRPPGTRASTRSVATAKHCRSWRQIRQSTSPRAFRTAAGRPTRASWYSSPTTRRIT